MTEAASARAPRRRVDGVLLLDKPLGLSSNGALQRAKRFYRAHKAGHTGTLDPLATGLLPLCFGEATKFAQFLLNATKSYTATVHFGVTTTTGDAEGQVVTRRDVALSRSDIAAALPSFIGRTWQTPPAHAALKLAGRNYYEYARAGVAIPRVAREVEINELALIEWNAPEAVLDVSCGKGTYMRVLAEDLGVALGCGAHLSALRRTATGGFAVTDAVTLSDLELMDEVARDACLLPVAALVAGLPAVTLDAEAAALFRNGRAVDAIEAPDGICAVFSGGDLLGVADAASSRVQPRRVTALILEE